MEILVVENDVLAALQLRKCLRQTNPEPRMHLVRNGFDALDFLDKSTKPDLVILNAHIPNINGYQIMEKMDLKDELKQIPVLLLTDEATPKSILRNCQLHNPPPSDTMKGRDLRMIAQKVRTFLVNSLTGR